MGRLRPCPDDPRTAWHDGPFQLSWLSLSFLFFFFLFPILMWTFLPHGRHILAVRRLLQSCRSPELSSNSGSGVDLVQNHSFRVRMVPRPTRQDLVQNSAAAHASRVQGPAGWDFTCLDAPGKTRTERHTHHPSTRPRTTVHSQLISTRSPTKNACIVIPCHPKCPARSKNNDRERRGTRRTHPFLHSHHNDQPLKIVLVVVDVRRFVSSDPLMPLPHFQLNQFNSA